LPPLPPTDDDDDDDDEEDHDDDDDDQTKPNPKPRHTNPFGAKRAALHQKASIIITLICPK
jgi:hypothetical protein